MSAQRHYEIFDSTPHHSATSDEIVAGDVVAVNVRHQGRREGVVIGSHHDSAGRLILEIQFDPGEYYHAWQPHVTRVRRVTHYRNAPPPRMNPKSQCIEEAVCGCWASTYGLPDISPRVIPTVAVL